MKPIIQINHLSKSFGNVKAVQDLSFHVKTFELFCLSWYQWCRKIHYNQYHVRTTVKRQRQRCN